MLPSEELLQSIDILAQNAVKDAVKIYTAIVTSVGDNNTCSVHVNGKTHSNIVYYGDTPTVNKSYRVFCPNGSMNQAFIITGGGSSGGGSTGATDYNQLTNRPSINGTTLSGNQTSSQLGLYGTNNAPPYPVTSVNGQTGNVVISTGGNVDSVNGKTGVVVLNAADVGALPADTVIPTVNNATLTIRRNSVDVGSFTANSAEDVNIDINVPTDKSDIGLGNVDNVKQYSATNPPPYPVTSVNGATGDVKSTFYVTVTQGDNNTATADKTAEEVYAAYAAGYAVYAIVNLKPDIGYSLVAPMVIGFKQSNQVALAFITLAGFQFMEVQYIMSAWSVTIGTLANSDDIPTIPEYLPNPNALTFTGAATGSYDGSAPLSVEIPSGGSGGISATARNLLITILRNGVYSSDQSANITELEKALGGTEIVYYTITNNLTNVTNSNSAGSIQEKTAYIASLTAVDGYTLDSVTVTMGGLDVTAEVYADGVINISSVTGDVEIVASATAVSTEPVLNTDGLVFDYDFRNARMESYNLSGWGNVYRTIDKTGTGLLFGQKESTGDGVGLADYNFFEQRLVSSETQKLTLGSSYTAQFLYRSQTLGGTRAQPDMLSWAYNTNFIYKIYLKPKYLVDTTETTVTDTEAVDIDVADYAVITYVVDGTKLTVYYNNSIIYDLDGSNYAGFTKWVDYGVPDTIYNQGYAVSFVGYNRALSEIEIVDNIEYFKTLEVTA